MSSVEARVLEDMATLADVAGEEVRARKLREASVWIRKLEERLEIYSAPNEQGERLYLGIGSTDGIGCREETIRMLQQSVESLRNGECRRHCRVRAEMWKIGFVWGVKYVNLLHGITKPGNMGDADKQYLVWRANDGKE